MQVILIRPQSVGTVNYLPVTECRLEIESVDKAFVKPCMHRRAVCVSPGYVAVGSPTVSLMVVLSESRHLHPGPITLVLCLNLPPPDRGFAPVGSSDKRYEHTRDT